MGSSVEALRRQVGPQTHDQLGHLGGDSARRCARPTRPGLKRRFSLSPPAGHQLGHPRPRKTVLGGYFSVGSPLHNNSSDNQADPRHPPPWTSTAMFLCLATYLSYVLNHNTLSPTTECRGRKTFLNLGPHLDNSGLVRTFDCDM